MQDKKCYTSLRVSHDTYVELKALLPLASSMDSRISRLCTISRNILEPKGSDSSATNLPKFKALDSVTRETRTIGVGYQSNASVREELVDGSTVYVCSHRGVD